MGSVGEDELRRIALNLITFKNHKIKYRIKKNGIDLSLLPELDKRQLADLGFLRKDIVDLKSRYREIAETEVSNCLKHDVDLIFKEDKCYPSLLGEIFDPPEYIYVKGDKSVLKSEKIAVVGSRKASSYGRLAVNAILPDLCRTGLVVVSGMAHGIDSLSHRIAIREGGKTIGVNAGGLNHLYPPGNRFLIHDIITNGCVITEFPMDTVPRPFFFPIRNRIIAGISRAVMVAEAAVKSGSLITARLAIDQNRDVFAIPGRIDSPLSTGTNALIKQGAKLISYPQDILEEYGIQKPTVQNRIKENLSTKELEILDLMAESDVKDIDYFVENSDLSVPEITSLLMGMVLKNTVMQVNGGFKRII